MMKHIGVLSKAATIAMRIAGFPVGGAKRRVLFEMYDVAAST
jgi:hypothetical protein